MPCSHSIESYSSLPLPTDEEDDAGDDNLEPISAENIIEGGRRTRGKTIDYAAAEKGGPEPDDDDDDDDFRAPEQDTEMKG